MRPIDEICRRCGVGSVQELERYITDIDQRLMKADLWDYRNPNNENNEIVRLLKQRVDLDSLVADEKYWFTQIIWFWYHHAASCALFKYRDRITAQIFADAALEHHELLPDHPNKITPLLYYLAYGRIEEAERWVKSFPADHDEAETAVGTLMDYQMAFCLKV
jgi:hypothetical protein